MKDLVQEGRQIQDKIRQRIVEDAAPDHMNDLIDEFGELSDQIDQVQAILKKMQTRFDEIDKELVPAMEKLKEVGQNSLQTKKYLVTIKRMGYERTNKSYQKGFELALTKVNATIKKVLTDALAATETTSKISASLGVQKIGEVSLIGTIMSKIKAIATSMIARSREALVSMKTLDVISKKMISSMKP